MKVLVLNGSPKGERSNTLRLTRAFVEGLGQKAEEINLYKADISECRGCFACWNKTPGKCVINDDMTQLLQKYVESDVIIYSFPLYYFGLPSRLKMFMDRQLPLILPFMLADAESGGHPTRVDMSDKKFVVISTCGFHTAQGNYDGVKATFDHVCGVNGYTTIFCGQGELFRVKELSATTEKYLQAVKQSGGEFLRGGITPQTRQKLQTPLFPREVFEKMADASWGVDKQGHTEDQSLVFTKQMAALYNTKSFDGKVRVVEMRYTDVGQTYQMVLQKDGSKVLTENFVTPTTAITTPLTVWQSIAQGEIRGDEAMMKKMYTVSGDFNLMLNWDKFFGNDNSSAQSADEKDQKRKKSNMTLLLLPWIAIWIALAIDSTIGSYVGIAVCAIVPLGYVLWRGVVYEYLSVAIVCGLCLVTLLGVPTNATVPASYLIFGLMWTATCFFKIPLTAHYSMENYGQDDALKNPLFVRTNKILTAAWGAIYMLSAVWTVFLLKTPLASYVGLLNNVVPLFMGIFTIWFQKWYPKHYASKK